MRKNKPETQQRRELAGKAGEFMIGNDLRVTRLGFGAMRITGNGIWGEPPDRAEAVRLLRRAVELGINFIDTADSDGPNVSEEIIAEALHPYPAHFVIATKAGFERPAPNRWVENGRPEHLEIRWRRKPAPVTAGPNDLYQLHRIYPKVPAEDQLGTLKDLAGTRQDQTHRFVGSERAADSARANDCADCQRPESLQRDGPWIGRRSGILRERSIRFIPWFPLGAGQLSGADSPIGRWLRDGKLRHHRWLWRGYFRDLQ